MAEKKQKEVDADSKEIKEEAKATFDDVKDTIKNVKFQNDAKETTGFVSKIFKNPLGILKETSEDKKNKNLKHALLLICLWILATLITGIYYAIHNKYLPAGTRFIGVIRNLLGPIIGLVAMSLIVYFNQKNSKKDLTATFTTITVASIPTILISVVGILRIFSSSFNYVLTPLEYFASSITLIFEYFAAKDLIGEDENSKFITKFIGIQFIYFVCYFVFQFLELYLPLL